MSPTTPEKANILIVDDMEENLVALEAVLGSLDQRLVRARSGEEALKAMLRQEFAVVLLDVLMPGMDGFETAASIKRLDQTKDVPIILLTGTDADTDYIYRGYAIGAADFLTKPFDPWLLRTKVNVFLDLHRKNRQLAAQAEQLRRLLVGERTPAESTGPVGSSESAESTGDALDKPRGGTTGTGAVADGGERLAEITERLAQIELQLRDAEGTQSAELADRIAELERAVGSLRVGRDT
ncbi:response regulator [Streptomyces sp. RLB3-17]|uniref:Response regulator n=1 Tax=Streptomyces mirabilis TaxID=68239 RepID=A0ABU3UIP7_9ACTN|nr:MULTISPECIES: response regulator [Streptomyces]MCX4612504.1 response regulator [Streptomyces mirabilis]MCX5352727.1 response regulator [Streptomyces mirabilis]MDU8993791.1 response regulator [Streptomyces mirabilis]NMI61683.1 response regulator [Streptomyces sp. RLA2-12]QDN60761.1 response regulator [Streptomyces sp. S1D4-20]